MRKNSATLSRVSSITVQDENIRQAENLAGFKPSKLGHFKTVLLQTPKAISNISQNQHEADTGEAVGLTCSVHIGETALPSRNDFSGGIHPHDTRVALLAKLAISAKGSLAPELLDDLTNVVTNQLRTEGHKLPENYPLLLLAISQKESRHNPDEVSPKGGRLGLFQIGTGAAEEVCNKLVFAPEGFNPKTKQQLLDPITNTEVAARYLAFCLEKFGGNLEHALAGFNQGPYAIKTAIQTSNPESSKAYQLGIQYARGVIGILNSEMAQTAQGNRREAKI